MVVSVPYWEATRQPKSRHQISANGGRDYLFVRRGPGPEGRVYLLLSFVSFYGSPLSPPGNAAIGCHHVTFGAWQWDWVSRGCTNENSDQDSAAPSGKQWYMLVFGGSVLLEGGIRHGPIEYVLLYTPSMKKHR